MKNISACSIFLIILLSALIAEFANAEEPGTEFWNAESVEAKLSERLKSKLEKEFRYNNEGLYYHHTDFTLVQKISDLFSIGPGFRKVYSRRNDNWTGENRPYITSFIKWKINRLDFEDRNNFEYRDLEDRANVYRYRNKLTVSYPTRTKMKFTPYISDEIFINLSGTDRGKLNRNRFYVGIKADPVKNLTADLSYLRQNSATFESSGRKWENLNGILLKIKFSF